MTVVRNAISWPVIISNVWRDLLKLFRTKRTIKGRDDLPLRPQMSLSKVRSTTRFDTAEQSSSYHRWLNSAGFFLKFIGCSQFNREKHWQCSVFSLHLRAKPSLIPSELLFVVSSGHVELAVLSSSTMDDLFGTNHCCSCCKVLAVSENDAYRWKAMFNELHALAEIIESSWQMKELRGREVIVRVEGKYV